MGLCLVTPPHDLTIAAAAKGPFKRCGEGKPKYLRPPSAFNKSSLRFTPLLRYQRLMLISSASISSAVVILEDAE
jgi:hypothetical protein